MKTLLEKRLFYFKQFRNVRTSESFQSEILCHGNTFCISKYEAFILFLTETFDLYLRNFKIAEKVSIFGTAFLQKCKYLQSFQF